MQQDIYAPGPRPASAVPATFRFVDDDHIELLPPVEGPDKLLFQGFCNALPIAFARLKRLHAGADQDCKVVPLHAAADRSTWVLQNIQVSQNYRNRGIGSALLAEVRHHCSHYGITRLVGDMTGDLPALRRWYLRNGFTVSSDNRLELLPG